MNKHLAIIAGSGALPLEVARAETAGVFVTFAGAKPSVPDGVQHFPAITEQLGALFDGLHQKGINEVVFAGALSRPAIDPARLDAKTTALMPGIMAAIGMGDDALLRHVIGIFEAEGFRVRAAHEVAPHLLLSGETSIGRAATPDELQNAKHGFDILTTLSPLDVGQACVVEAGQCLGIETLQGSDALLEFVAQTKPHLRRGAGVFVKAPKSGQDLRIDMPTIGPDTIDKVAYAGLAGLCLKAGGVLVVGQDEVGRLVEKHGLFLSVF